jgi:RND superfamily putative drug exporter
VAYSGLTVAFAQSALFLIASPGIRSIAGATIIVVAVAVLSATTLLPVLITTLGRRAWEPGYLRRRIGRLRGNRRGGPGFWVRWTTVVMRHPGPSLAAAIALLLLAAAPALGLTVRNSAVSQLPRGDEVRQGMALVAKQQGPGVLGPLQVMVGSAGGSPLAAATVNRVSAAIRRDPAIQGITAARLSTTGDRALVTATLRVDPESQAARDTVDRLRGSLPGLAGRAQINVGGTTAIILDFDRLVTRQLWRPILFVLAAELVILLVLLQSLVLAITAALMNLLSVVAAYGLLTGVFQDGWLESLGIHRAVTIYPIALPLVLTLASGLSMDYHIFMLSRIRERYLATRDTRRAVGEALASSASPISSAALIMVIVFLAFMTAGSPSIQQLGFALAVVIALDATIVRLVLVPSAMVLLGEWNWWLPRPLRRALPAVRVADVEVMSRG